MMPFFKPLNFHFCLQGIAAIGNAFFFLGSRLGDSLLVQFASILSSSVKEEVCIQSITIPC